MSVIHCLKLSFQEVPYKFITIGLLLKIHILFQSLLLTQKCLSTTSKKIIPNLIKTPPPHAF